MNEWENGPEYFERRAYLVNFSAFGPEASTWKPQVINQQQNSDPEEKEKFLIVNMKTKNILCNEITFIQIPWYYQP